MKFIPRIRIFKVHGDSMEPLFTHGDFIASYTLPFMRYRVGDIIVVSHPRYDRIIKRIDKINSKNEFSLRGDNLMKSVSSKSIGWIPNKWVTGKLLWQFKPNH